MNNKGKAIVIKCDKQQKKVELSLEQEEIKSKLEEIDKKVNDIESLAGVIQDNNKDTIFSDDLVGNVVGVMALTAASKVIGEYFGVSSEDINDMI